MYYKEIMNKNGYVEYKSTGPAIFQSIFHYIKSGDETKQIFYSEGFNCRLNLKLTNPKIHLPKIMYRVQLVFICPFYEIS